MGLGGDGHRVASLGKKDGNDGCISAACRRRLILRLALGMTVVRTLIAATQQQAGTIAPVAAREFIIHGITKDGRTFRPSDWAERLAGAMSCFRPGSAGKPGIGAFIGYSPYCVPTTVGSVKAVIVNEALRDVEPMAWDFVVNFARDNDLQMGEVCTLPEPKRP
jgi:hypothetical protein